MESLSIFRGSCCTRFCLCPLRVESPFLQVLWKSWNPILLDFKARVLGDFMSLCCRYPNWEAWSRAHNLYNFFDATILQFMCHSTPRVIGFDFIMIASLLPFHCGFSFVFLGVDIIFCVSFSILCWWLLNRLLWLLMLSQKISVCPSIPPPWNNLLSYVFMF